MTIFRSSLARKVISGFLVLLFLLGDGALFFDVGVREALAAQVTIDTTVSTNSASHVQSQPSSVFISDQVGYKFYRDSDGRCVYRKTTDGGTNWGGVVIVDNQTDCEAIVIWYDQWTPGDTGNFIHISTMDAGNDDLWYNRLDTSDDSLLLSTAPVSVVLSQNVLSISAATANHSITKGTDGIVYIAIADNGDRFVMSCASNCQTDTNWTEVGDGTQMDADEDLTLMLPLDNGHILLINRDITADDIRSKIWNGTSWSASWLTVDANAPEGNTYDIGMTAVRSPETGDVHLVYMAQNDSFTVADHDIRVAKFNGTSWSNLPDLITDDTRGLLGLKLGIDANTDTLYLAYSARTTIGSAPTANVYYATTTAAMTSWSAEQGPVNTAPGDMYGVDINYFSDQRLYVTWYEAALDDMFGDTIADVSPPIIVSSLGTQRTEIRASSTDVYLGGSFVVQGFNATRTLTNITINETGTVDGAGAIRDIKLYYDTDTTAPYNCVGESFGGTESQFGITDTNGFSAANGSASFSDVVTIGPSQVVCVYTVMSVLKAAVDGSTIEVEITNPVTDVVVSGGVEATPASVVSLGDTTIVVDSDLTQTHFHWRNDNGSESTATSRTAGVEDTPLSAIQQNTPVRLRLGISNEGSTTSLPVSLRLEYAENTSTCETVASWNDIGASGGAWELYDSSFLTDATDTTDISIANGGVSDENTVFLSPNGGVRDQTSQLSPLQFLTTEWTEVEFSIIASTSAAEGNSYCFRVSDAGQALSSYSIYPEATIASDVTVSASGTQVSTLDIPSVSQYIGGVYRIVENSSSRTVTSIRISEQGSVDAQTGITNVRLLYDLDTTAPYDCASESYSGSESQFGVATSSFSGANGSALFTDSVLIATTSTLCIYPVVNINSTAQNAETLDVFIANPAGDVVVSSGSISPSVPVDITASTTLRGAILTQGNYHWRDDNGSETTASSSVGDENVVLSEVPRDTPIRLRVGVSNEGATTSVPTRFQIEFGIKISTCDAVSFWTDVDTAADAFDMNDSTFLTNGSDTTNIATTSGGISDPGGKSFLSPNGGVRDTESRTGSTTLTESQFVELEYSLRATNDTAYETTYCFRITNNGIPLQGYQRYAELTTAPKRDYKVQRGTNVVTGTGVTLLAGTDYDAPSTTSRAFVRITNAYYTGAGDSVAPGTTQNADDVTAYISNPQNLLTSFTISRPPAATQDTRVSWEIVEFIGDTGTDNEMIVRQQSTISLTGTNRVATGSVVASVVDDSKVVVFITGSSNRNTGSTGYFNGQVTARWNAATNQPVFERIGNGSQVDISYAVVEYTGVNWRIQRVEHQYTAAGQVETESISAITSIDQAFLHTQKRVGASATQVNFGHEVWISSIGAVSFFLPALAATSTGQVSVAWVIENMQTSTGKMEVFQSDGIIVGGTQPRTTIVSIGDTVNGLNNASIFAMTTKDQNTNNYPRTMAGLTIIDVNNYEIWNSTRVTNINFNYRTEIVQWPTADLALRQNYYQFYVDNGDLTPDDPWPVGPADVGENTAITSLDEPLAEGDRIRIRMSVRVSNATLPAGLQAFTLQYGLRSSTCSAVSVWSNVGDIGSGEVWRGYDGVPTDGDPLPSTILSVSDVTGRYVENGPSAANPNQVEDSQEVEYDWNIEHNGAAASSFYCFRMIKSDGTPLDAYNNYPQLRTAGFTPISTDWRWFADASNETPTSSLAATNVSPTDITDGTPVALRVAITEIKNVQGNNAKFRLQFSDFPDFRVVSDVVAIADCAATSTWCYADGGGVDNAMIASTTLLGVDACVAGVGPGCGTHNESSDLVPGFTHPAGATTEYSFIVQQRGARAGGVYYFRLYDVTNDLPVIASSTYPSAVVESAQLVFTSSGLPAGTELEGVIADVTTTATSVPFGSVTLDTEYEAIYRLDVNTNATAGFQLLMYQTTPLQNSYGTAVPGVLGSNSVPVAWSDGCIPTAAGCFGYHAGDDTLAGGSSRFAPDDSYAALSTTPEEVMYSGIPSETIADIVFKLQIRAGQSAGDYFTDIVYLVVPSF